MSVMFFGYLIVWTAWGIGARRVLGRTYMPWLLRAVRTPWRALLVYGTVFALAVIVTVVLVQMADGGADLPARLLVLVGGTMPLAPLVFAAMPGKPGLRGFLYDDLALYRRDGRLHEVGAQRLSTRGQRAIGRITGGFSLLTLAPLFGATVLVTGL